MSKTPFRSFRIEALIRENLAPLLSVGMSASNVLITVKSVTLNRSSNQATVACSIVSADTREEDLLAELNKKSPYLRHLLAKKVNMQRTPQLRFISDSKGIAQDKIRAFLEHYPSDPDPSFDS